MKIEVLYFSGCPNHKPTVERVRTVAQRLGVADRVLEVQVTEEDDLAHLKFVGSPTVHIDGMDIDPAQRCGTTPKFSCRMFDGMGVPPVSMIERAIQQRWRGRSQ